MTFIQWTQMDFDRFLTTKNGVSVQQYQDTSSDYPWIQMRWSLDDSILYGAGVIQCPSPTYNLTQGLNVINCTLANYFHWDAWSNIIQFALALGLANLPLINDGSFEVPDANLNQQSQVTLMDYIRAMLRPAEETSSGTIPWAPNGGSFNPDRLCMRIAIPGVDAGLLPYLQPLSNPNVICVYPVIPPRGYVSIGHFIVSNTTNLINPSGRNFRSSPTNLVFLYQDARFVQPPADLYPWPNLTNKPQYWNQRSGAIFQKTINQQDVSGKTQIKISYVYSTFGNFLFNGISSTQTNPNWENWPSIYPWAINTQLIRFFPNGPNGDSSKFTPININRLLFGGQGINAKNNSYLPTAKIVNPNYGMSYFYPFENGATEINLAFSPTNQSKQQTWPILIPYGIKSMFNCCTGQAQEINLIWDWSSFPPFPASVNNPNTSLTVAICQAGNYSFNYRPGGDCDALTGAFCAPTGPQYENSNNCLCYNTKKMLKNIGLNVTSDTVALATTLERNIACVYEPCANNAYAFKKSTQVPTNGEKCPDLQNCIVQNNEFTGKNPTTINNYCTQNGGTPTNGNPRLAGRINISVYVMIYIAAFLFIATSAIILLIRVRKKRKSEERADHSWSKEDLYETA